MATVRKTVSIPGDNSHTVENVLSVLNRCPWDAKVRTKTKIGADPEIIIWWDEEL